MMINITTAAGVHTPAITFSGTRSFGVAVPAAG